MDKEGPNYVQRPSKDQQEKNVKEMLARKEDLIFMSPILEGFSLKNKEWCKFRAAHLSKFQRAFVLT